LRRNPFAELGTAHRVLKTAGATRHRERMRKVPVWANDNEKIKEYVLARFPKMDTDPVQRKHASRIVRMIYLYYVEGSTSAQVAEALSMTHGAVRIALHRVKRSMSGAMKPSHRPKNPVPIDSISGNTGDDGHITL
jgi:DNA-directed RNA polymerase specialized sigma24 family protein